MIQVALGQPVWLRHSCKLQSTICDLVLGTVLFGDEAADIVDQIILGPEVRR